MIELCIKYARTCIHGNPMGVFAILTSSKILDLNSNPVLPHNPRRMFGLHTPASPKKCCKGPFHGGGALYIRVRVSGVLSI